ncbi:hypothetical protein EVB91_158 [Rhizobium phage RHph_I1_18]|nr:hypothetical protein EVB91_158 [Rhizobium phage RHph_I1_18]
MLIILLTIVIFGTLLLAVTSAVLATVPHNPIRKTDAISAIVLGTLSIVTLSLTIINKDALIDRAPLMVTIDE